MGFYCHPKSLDWDLDSDFGLRLDNIYIRVTQTLCEGKFFNQIPYSLTKCNLEPDLTFSSKTLFLLKAQMVVLKQILTVTTHKPPSFVGCLMVYERPPIDAAQCVKSVC